MITQDQINKFKILEEYILNAPISKLPDCKITLTNTGGDKIEMTAKYFVDIVIGTFIPTYKDKSEWTYTYTTDDGFYRKIQVDMSWDMVMALANDVYRQLLTIIPASKLKKLKGDNSWSPQPPLPGIPLPGTVSGGNTSAPYYSTSTNPYVTTGTVTPSQTLSVSGTPWGTSYEIDLDKVTTLEDIKNIMEAMSVGISVQDSNPNFSKVKHLLKGIK